MTLRAYEVISIPDKDFDRNIIFDAFGREPFAVTYDFSSKTTKLCPAQNTSGALKEITGAIPGIGFADPSPVPLSNELHTVLSIYRKPDTVDKSIFGDLFSTDLDSGSLSIAFVPFDEKKLAHAKAHIEGLLSKKDTKETKSVLSDVFSRRVNTSLQRDNFTDSDETMFLTEVLESINRSVLRNGIAYGVFAALHDDTGALERYVRSRFLVLSSARCGFASLLEDNSTQYRLSVLPMGLETANRFLAFRGVFDIGYSLPVVMPRCSGDIAVGTYLKGATLDTSVRVCVEHSAFNLGSIITGLPGSGKTKEAMAILDELLLLEGRPSVFVLSPTDEWDRFAESHGMGLIKAFDGSTPINFFKCPGRADVSKFYEDLAMILSSASNAGPYRNPMEKCMLSAFRKIYSQGPAPDPMDVYDQIEEAVIDFHGRRTKSGAAKYTKHGENIRSALENLRAILARSEYSAKDGDSVEKFSGTGAVFNLSRVSVSTKPYLYALMLNQIYSMTNGFDTKGDDALRLLICIEEAQIMFRDKDSAAVQDLKYRIQDFRKQGIGIMLLTHNVSDIEPSVRRLCQIKLYLKQAPDVAPIAAKDLTFTYVDEDQAVQKLKHLDSRNGAFSYVEKDKGEKIARDTIFIRTKEYPDPIAKFTED